MRIVLAQPRGSNWVPGYEDVSSVVNRMAPLGLLSLAACLERDGHDVTIRDGLGPDASSSLAEEVRRILALRPDLVGFTATTSSFLDAAEMARRIKDASPATRTVVGGVFVSSMGPELLDRFDGIDAFVLGEGELTLCNLASGKPEREIAGLVVRGASGAVRTAPRGPILDLDSLPFPAYHLLAGFPRAYHLPLFCSPGAPGATLITSRGCPYKCSFCDRSVFGRGYRYNSPRYVYEHLAYLARNYRVRHVNVYDDLFTHPRARIAELCRLLIDEPLGLTFNCAARIGHTDDDLLALLKRAGAYMISLGIESGDPDLLRRHKAGIELAQVPEAVRAIRKHGLKVKGLFIAGLPGETPETLRRTSDLIQELDLDDMNLSRFTPFHGAPSWASIREEGEFDENWRLMNCNNFVFVSNGFASKQELEVSYAEALKRFYTSRAYHRRLARRAWTCRHSVVLFLRNLPAMLRTRRQFEPSILAAASRPAGVRSHTTGR